MADVETERMFSSTSNLLKVRRWNVLDKLSQSDRADLQRQLRQVVTSLRSLRQAPGDLFVANFRRISIASLESLTKFLR